MILSTEPNYRVNGKTALALGTFDGMHLGHRAVIGAAVSAAQRLGVSSAVWCFSAPPKSTAQISTLEEKAEIMEFLGVDTVVAPTFNDDIKKLTPREFFDKVIADNMSAVYVVCGFNYTFGSHGAGSAALLGELCRRHGIEFECIAPVSVDGELVSSTKIRSLLANNETEKANILLGK